MSKYEDHYTLEEIADFITKDLTAQKMPYEVEKRDELIIIWIDRQNNFTCKINVLDIGVSHLKGYRLFNLDEGKDEDMCSVQNAINYIHKVASNEIFQEETYKFNKLCSTKQYMIIDGEKIICSGTWILHMLYFLPFVKKRIKTITYQYSSEKISFD